MSYSIKYSNGNLPDSAALNAKDFQRRPRTTRGRLIESVHAIATCQLAKQLPFMTSLFI